MMLTSFVCSEFVSELHLLDVCRCAAYMCCTFLPLRFSLMYTRLLVFSVYTYWLFVAVMWCLLLLTLLLLFFGTIVDIHILVFRL
jgi:hypothetical protein